MRRLIPVALVLAAAATLAGVGAGSQYPDDAMLISDLLEHYVQGGYLLTLDGPDSALVCFVALGREWSASVTNWTDLMYIYAITSGVDMEKPWSIRDVVVSFGETWCTIPMEDIFALSQSDSTITEEEWWAEMQALTDVHIQP